MAFLGAEKFSKIYITLQAEEYGEWPLTPSINRSLFEGSVNCAYVVLS